MFLLVLVYLPNFSYEETWGKKEILMEGGISNTVRRRAKLFFTERRRWETGCKSQTPVEGL